MKNNKMLSAMIVAFIASVIVYCVMIHAEKNALRGYEKEAVMVAAQDIVSGIVITEKNIDTYFKEVSMDKALIPDNSLLKEEFIGRQAVGVIDKGAMITKSMLEEIEVRISSLKYPVVAGFKAEDLYQVVSGTLRSGDLIHIYIVDDDTKEVSLEWQEVYVQEVFDSSGNSIQNEDQGTAAQRVNILLEKADVQRFYQELSSGALRVTKVWK